jgi:hypothetical protein
VSTGAGAGFAGAAATGGGAAFCCTGAGAALFAVLCKYAVNRSINCGLLPVCGRLRAFNAPFKLTIYNKENKYKLEIKAHRHILQSADFEIFGHFTVLYSYGINK